MAHFEFVGKDHIKRGCHCPLEECSLDCSLRRKLLNKPTNADRIRSMSDEELAHLLHTAEEHIFNGNLWNYEQWQTWLKSPVEVSE